MHDVPMTTHRTPNVTLVLDAVRETGRSAIPQPGQKVSDLVFSVAVAHGLNPVQLQQAVRSYAKNADEHEPAEHQGHFSRLGGTWWCDTCNSPYCDLA